MEGNEDAALAEEWTELCAGAGAPDLEDVESFTQAIRLATINLLLNWMQSSILFRLPSMYRQENPSLSLPHM
jgi:hypothetical protein